MSLLEPATHGEGERRHAGENQKGGAGRESVVLQAAGTIADGVSSGSGCGENDSNDGYDTAQSAALIG